MADPKEFEIKVLRDDLAQYAYKLTKAEINKSISRGINYALGVSRTRMKKALQEEYNLPASALVTSQGSGGTLKIGHAKSTQLCGSVKANIAPESLAHFRPVWYRDIIQKSIRGGGGGGFYKFQKRGKGWTGTKVDTRNTKKSGVYFEVVKGRRELMPGAFMIWKGSSGLVMARGEYQGSGKTKDFKWAKGGRLPIEKLNAKSVYWGVLHPDSIHKWQPPTEKEWVNETVRQMELLIK